MQQDKAFQGRKETKSAVQDISLRCENQLKIFIRFSSCSFKHDWFIHAFRWNYLDFPAWNEAGEEPGASLAFASKTRWLVCLFVLGLVGHWGRLCSHHWPVDVNQQFLYENECFDNMSEAPGGHIPSPCCFTIPCPSAFLLHQLYVWTSPCLVLSFSTFLV